MFQVSCEIKGEIRDDFKIFGLSSWKDGVGINCWGETVKGGVSELCAGHI